MNVYNLYHHELPPLLAEAAQTPAVQRLKAVGMNCGCEYTSFPFFQKAASYSRFEHSLGVGLIVWHFTREAVPAMAALLHDIATPPFAHVIDFLHGDHLTQESTEEGTAASIASSAELQLVLRKYDLTTEDVSDYHRYPVADNDAPKLSADRLEYTLGNLLAYRFCGFAEIQQIYQNLQVALNEAGEAELSFQDPQMALFFAQQALKCSKIYTSDESRFAMQSLADLLQSALDAGVLAPDDLSSSEPPLIKKLLSVPASAAQWERFRNYHVTYSSPAPPDDSGNWKQIPAKKRYIDPYVCCQGRVSSLFPDFRQQLDAYRNAPLDYWVRGE